MSDMNLESIKVKIKKLLALSTSPNMAEAEAAMQKANKLLLDYNLEMGDISDTHSEIIEDTYRTGSAERVHETNLIGAIGHYNFCEIIRYSGRDWKSGNFRNTKHYSLSFIGRPHNVAAAKVMCDYIFEVLDKGVAKEVKGEGRATVFSYKVGFCQSMTSKIYGLIAERQKEAQATANSTTSQNPDVPKLECTALTIIENTKAENEKFIQEKFNKAIPAAKIKEKATRNNEDIYAYMSGALLAKKTQLNQQIRA